MDIAGIKGAILIWEVSSINTQTPKTKKSDDTKEKISQLKQHISNTESNMELAEDIISDMPGSEAAPQLRAQNTRRQQAVADMKEEIQDINSPKKNKKH